MGIGTAFGRGLTRVRVTCFWRPQASASVHNRSQPFATVRLRPLWPRSCRAYGKSRRNMTFLTSEVVLCGRRNTFATFSEDVLHFSWHAQHFGHLRCHFPWQAQHFGRSCCVFSVNRIVRAARSGDKVQIPWLAWHFVTSHENRRNP